MKICVQAYNGHYFHWDTVTARWVPNQLGVCAGFSCSEIRCDRAFWVTLTRGVLAREVPERYEEINELLLKVFGGP